MRPLVLPGQPAVRSSEPGLVAYQTVDGVYGVAGNDYQFTTGSLTFNPGGPLTQTVPVPILDDGEDDGYSTDFSLGSRTPVPVRSARLAWP